MLWILKYQRTNHQFNLVFFVCHPIQGATHVVDDVMETKIGDVTRVIDFNSFANKATHDPICVCWYEEMRNYGVQNGLILSYFRVLNKHVFCMCMYIYIFICIHIVYTSYPLSVFQKKRHEIIVCVLDQKTNQAMVQVWCHGSSGVSKITDGQGASISEKLGQGWWKTSLSNIRNPRKQHLYMWLLWFTTFRYMRYKQRYVCTNGCCSGKRPQG